MVCGFSLSVLADQTVTLAWNPSDDPNVVCYRVHYGTESQNYTSVVTADTNYTVTITGLVEGTTYYFAATSVDSAGNESDYSDEISYTVPVTTATLAAPTTSSDGQFSFNVTGVDGDQYVVEASTNLVDWDSIETNTTPFEFVDPDAASFNQRFYRTFDLTLYNATMATNATATTDTNSDTSTDTSTTDTTTDTTTTATTTDTTTATTTDPATDPAAATLTSPATSADGQFNFNVAGVAGDQYVVQASTNLVDWDSIETNTAPFAFVDPDAASFSQRFYRTYDLTVYNAATGTATNPDTTTDPSSTDPTPADPATDSTAAMLTSPTTDAYGQFSFNVAGVDGDQYVVQTSTNLVDWDSLETNTAPFAFVDPDAASFSQRFYRTYDLTLFNSAANTGNNVDPTDDSTSDPATDTSTGTDSDPTSAKLTSPATSNDEQFSRNMAGVDGGVYVVQASTHSVDRDSLQTSTGTLGVRESDRRQLRPELLSDA
jgi:hypothetical protein